MNAQSPPPAGGQVPPESPLEAELIAALRTIFDPEIPVNIYDLGLIYSLKVSEPGCVELEMTLTAPACPVAGTFPATVESRLLQVPGVRDVRVTLVWEPAWTMARIPEAVKLQLGLL